MSGKGKVMSEKKEVGQCDVHEMQSQTCRKASGS